jgi:hypothetical protein
MTPGRKKEEQKGDYSKDTGLGDSAPKIRTYVVPLDNIVSGSAF